MTPPFTLEESPQALSLKLAGDLTIEHAAPLYAAVAPSLRHDRNVIVDTTDLNRIDAAILQVLIVVARSSGEGSSLARSSAWDEALIRYGLSDPFSLRSNVSPL